jgi:hypothetical protein
MRGKRNPVAITAKNTWTMIFKRRGGLKLKLHPSCV